MVVLAAFVAPSVLEIGLLGEMEVRHHGLETLLLLLELQLQLGHDLHLDACLRRALVVQHVLGVDVLEEGVDVVAVGLAARPLAGAVAEQGVMLVRQLLQGSAELRSTAVIFLKWF